MKIDIHFQATLEVPEPVPSILQIEVITWPDGSQVVDTEELSITPFAESEPFRDFYRNPCRRLLMPAGEVVVDYRAQVTLMDSRVPFLHPVQEDALTLPPDTLIYTLPSRYCQSDRMGKMASDLFGQTSPGYARVQTIVNWINEHVSYEYGTSDSSTSAFDTATQRIGVCRDFAHLGIAFCRALNIPARYVAGYCLDLEPPDLHAYFQAYLNGRWVSFDATELQPRPALVTIAVGRDAADCAWSTFYGQGQTNSMIVEVSGKSVGP